MDTTRKFDGYAKDYTAGRPSYAEELITCMYEKYGISDRSVIADIGSGTGKFAKHLLEKGSEVYCVEPNEDMRHTAEKELNSYENFHSVSGGAEQTTLSDHFVDFITTAQSFHWFNVSKFRQECKALYESVQNKICDKNSFEFIEKNTYFYLFENDGNLIGGIYYFMDGKLYLNGFATTTCKG